MKTRRPISLMDAAGLLGFVARSVVAEPDVGAVLRHLDGDDRADPFASGHERHTI